MERILDFLLNPHDSRRATKSKSSITVDFVLCVIALPSAGRRKSSTNKKIKAGSSGGTKKPKLSSDEETAGDEESEDEEVDEEADEEEGGEEVDSEEEEEKQEHPVEIDEIEIKTKEEVKEKPKVIYSKSVDENSLQGYLINEQVVETCKEPDVS